MTVYNLKVYKTAKQGVVQETGLAQTGLGWSAGRWRINAKTRKGYKNLDSKNFKSKTEAKKYLTTLRKKALAQVPSRYRHYKRSVIAKQPRGYLDFLG